MSATIFSNAVNALKTNPEVSIHNKFLEKGEMKVKKSSNSIFNRIIKMKKKERKEQKESESENKEEEDGKEQKIKIKKKIRKIGQQVIIKKEKGE